MDTTDPITTALSEFPATPTLPLVVFIVWRMDTDTWTYSCKHLETIQSTREKAQEYIPENAYPGEYDIEEYVVE